MKLNRRNFLTAGAIAAAGHLAHKAHAAGELNRVRGKTYVAASPPVMSSIPRTPGPQCIMVVGGHSDDADIICGCTTAKLIAKGVRVKFVAACNGDIGHHIHDRPTTAAIRRRPLILLIIDVFTVPRVMRPDILIDADPYIEKWCDALDCQQSQFYEWLAWDKGIDGEMRAISDRMVNIVGRNAYLKKYWANRKENDANLFAAAWCEQYPGKPVPKMVESYENSEYGRPSIAEDFALLMAD